MERVVLILALLAGLHLMLRLFQLAAQTVKDWLLRKPELTDTPDPVQECETDWRPYHAPACQRRCRIAPDPAQSGEASFEVIT